MPYTTAQARCGHRSLDPADRRTANFSARGRRRRRSEIARLLRERHRLGDATDDDFTVRNQNELAEAAGGDDARS